MTIYHGSCHCGAVRFEIDTELTELTQCDCSLCRKKNALMAPVHESKLRVVAGEDNLGLYQWNMKIAKHYFCKTCGIYPFHKKRSAPDTYGVNVFCLDDADIAGVPIRQADGKSMSVAGAGSP
jgi:hypothetical protein